MTWKHWAWLLLGGGFAAGLTYEFVAIANHWLTITQMLQRSTELSPAVPFLYGCIAGGLSVHFFFYKRNS